MPTDTEIQTERQRLYDSAALREDINDDEATVLLEWGEKHVVRLGQAAADNADLEQKARFLRQLIKNINRFVGQRQYNDRAGQIGYMEKVTKWLENPSLGFKAFTADELLDKLPPDAKDMAATLRALLDAIDPGGNTGPQGKPDAPPQDRLGALKDAVSAQSVQSEGTPPNRPSTLNDVTAQAAQQTDPHARPNSPAPDDVRQSVIGQMKEDHREKSEEAAHRPQTDGQTGSPSLFDVLRKVITDHVQEKHPDPKGNEALESLRQSVEEKQDSSAPSAQKEALEALRQSVEKSQDEAPADERGEVSNRSPHQGQSSGESRRSAHDPFINRPHTREEDEENGKNTK